jgi:hypothetical protein
MAIQDGIVENVAIQGVILWDVAIQDAIVQNVAIQGVILWDVASQDGIVRDMAIQGAILRDVAIQDGIVRDPDFLPAAPRPNGDRVDSNAGELASAVGQHWYFGHTA